jgi:hypothetical protein
VAGLFASFSLPDCSLCHAATVDAGGALLSGHLDGATAVAPDCTTCHTPPAQYHTRSSALAASPYACSVCHESFAPATHRDGATPLPGVTCATCHGDAAAIPAPTAAAPRAAAPPADKFGNAVSVVVGAHAAHLDDGTYSNVVACGSCHPGVASYAITHANGSTQVGFAAGPGKSGSFTAGAAGTAGSCSSTWCHGNFPGGGNATPSWDGAVACTSCHPLAPVTGAHSFHVDLPALGGEGYNCLSCHVGFTGTRDGAGVVTSVAIDPTTAKPNHVNGTKNVAPITGTWDPAPKSCSSVGCHLDPGATVNWY